MIEFFRKIFDSGFTPHGQSYLMRPEIIWLHVASDALIAIAFYSILVTLAYFACNRRDLPYRRAFVTFGLFILACGMTHLMEIWTVWQPVYWLSGGVKAVTALASVPTAIMLVRLIPTALRLPSPSALRRANSRLELEITRRIF